MKKISRKDFLKNVGVGIGSLAAISLMPSKVFANNDKIHTYYKLQASDNSCNACKKHSTNKCFRTRKMADNNRCHQYCSCAIVKKKCSEKEYNFWFKNEDIYDFRWKR